MLTSRTREEKFGTIQYNPLTDKFNLQSKINLSDLAKEKLSGPLTLHWIVTMRCNARCPYCYELSSLLKPSDKEKVLFPEEIKMFVEDFAQAGGFRLYLTGGEPTLHPYLSNIIQNAYEKNIKSVINSNGIQMPEEIYESIKAYQSRLSFSLDSHMQEIHDRARKQRSYNSIVATLKRAAEDSIDTRVISVMQDNQEPYWINFGRFLQNIGVKNWFIQSEIKYSEKLDSNRLESRLHAEFPSMKIRVLPAIFDSFLYIMPDGKVASNIWSPQKKNYGIVPNEPIKDIWNRNEKITVGDYQGILQINNEGGLQ